VRAAPAHWGIRSAIIFLRYRAGSRDPAMGRRPLRRLIQETPYFSKHARIEMPGFLSGLKHIPPSRQVKQFHFKLI
jgi:hypothetical protein